MTKRLSHDDFYDQASTFKDFQSFSSWFVLSTTEHITSPFFWSISTQSFSASLARVWHISLIWSSFSLSWYIPLAIFSCSRSSFRHPSHILISFPKMIYLYLSCVSMIAFSRSYFVFRQFLWGIFNSLLPLTTLMMSSGSFFYNQLNIQHTCSSLLFTPPNIYHHHLNHLTYNIAGFLHQSIYTLQHIPEDGSFYLFCVQSQILTLLLHGNTCHMERKLLTMKTAIVKHLFLYFRNIKQHCMGWILVVFLYTMAKHVI